LADTIVAIATAIGESAIGVIRVTGPDAIAIVDPLVRGAQPLAAFPSHVLRRVDIVDAKGGECVDAALCVVMLGPRSYTGEDVVELSCHGAPALLRLVTQWIIARGARLAEPGEFTRRAFVNGRMDLAQAEAVAMLISARTERAVALAARALAGGLADRVRAWRDALVQVVAGLEVALDFPDEHVGDDAQTARAAIARLRAEVDRAVTSARHGRLVHDGITIALVGPPNAGKSSLLNALLGQDRAIVSEAPGTTRDVVEATTVIAGVPVRLLDTAGLDVPRDPIEAEGMRRTRRAVDESDLLLVVLDSSKALDQAVMEETAAHPRVIVRAKSDLPPHPDAATLEDAVHTSSVTEGGIDALRDRLAQEIEQRVAASGDEGGIVASLRQMELIERISASLASSVSALEHLPIETALVDLKLALLLAGEVLGVEVGDAVLDRIFSSFCVGK